ncbi:MAG TPA: four helix bundle protein [Balneolaceae bacterium]|nr:four helix bundle protein [Balneolaceae bacterium]
MSQKVEKFEDLNIWKESMGLVVRLYNELKDCRDFGLRDQMQRAAVSVPSNIAEGFERKTNKDFIRFLYIAKASSAELRTQLYLCKKLGLIEKNESDLLIDKTRKISSMTHNLIKTRSESFS